MSVLILASVSTFLVILFATTAYIVNNGTFSKIKTDYDTKMHDIVSQMNNAEYKNYEIDKQNKAILNKSLSTMNTLQEIDSETKNKLTGLINDLTDTKSQLDQLMNTMPTVAQNEEQNARISGIESTFTLNSGIITLSKDTRINGNLKVNNNLVATEDWVTNKKNYEDVKLTRTKILGDVDLCNETGTDCVTLTKNKNVIIVRTWDKPNFTGNIYDLTLPANTKSITFNTENAPDNIISNIESLRIPAGVTVKIINDLISQDPTKTTSQDLNKSTSGGDLNLFTINLIKGSTPNTVAVKVKSITLTRI